MGQLFDLMKREPEYTGIGGYLNSPNRTRSTDFLLMAACQELKLRYSQLFLWVNSRYARHFMDGEPIALAAFMNELRSTIPDLEAEIKDHHSETRFAVLASMLARFQCYCPVDIQDKIRAELTAAGYDWRAEIFGATIRELSAEQLMKAIEKEQTPEDMEATEDTRVSATFLYSTADSQSSAEITFHIVGTEERTCATGVHLTGLTDKELGYRLGRAVEDCFCKGFDSIYIHVGAA